MKNPYPPEHIYGQIWEYGMDNDEPEMLFRERIQEFSEAGGLVAVYEFKEFVRIHQETIVAPATPDEIEAHLAKVEADSQEQDDEEKPF